MAQYSRREFLKQASVVPFTILPPYLALGRADAEGRQPPSSRINLASIGCGSRGGVNIEQFLAGGNTKPVAFCDVESNTRNVWTNRFPEAAQFADFRVMFDTMGDDIDAVMVATPDHTHFVATIDAMRRGKHVYVEKPLAHTFRETELLMQAEEKYGVVTQMGNQGHTSEAYSQFKQLVEAGLARDIVKVDAWKTPGIWFMEAEKRISAYPKGGPAPESLDWDLWCGPAEKKPFHRLYHPFDWRGFYLYGCGMLGDWGAHIIDFAHEFLQLGLPTRLKALKMEEHSQVIFPLRSHLSMHFPSRGPGLPACDLIWHDGSNCYPTVDKKFWEPDSEGKASPPNYGGGGTLLHRVDEDFLIMRYSHNHKSTLITREAREKYQHVLETEPVERLHHESFVQACMGNGTTNSPFSIAGPLTQTLLMGVICQYLNTDLDFDLKTRRFLGNTTANALLDGPAPRLGWEDYYKIL